MNFGIIILAAGSSSRMTHSKQLLNYKGQTLIRNTALISQKLNAKQTICVTGFLETELKSELNDMAIQFVHNPNYKKGMSSSLVYGLKATNKDIDGILIMLCDQPLIPLNHFENIIRTASQLQNPIIATSYKNTYGAPSFFKRELFKELLDLDTKKGAKSVIKGHRNSTHFIDCEEAAFDIDTDTDYQNIVEDQS